MDVTIVASVTHTHGIQRREAGSQAISLSMDDTSLGFPRSGVSKRILSKHSSSPPYPLSRCAKMRRTKSSAMSPKWSTSP